MATSEAVSGLGLLLGLACAPAVWYWVVVATRAKGWWAIASHLCGALLAAPTVLAMFAIISDPGWYSFVFFGMVLVPLYLVVKPATVAPPATTEQAPPPAAAVALAGPPPLAAAETQAPSWQVHAAARAAAHAAEPHDVHDDPLANWHRTEPPPRRLAAAKKIRHGKKLDVITFSYLNQKGELSTRRVAAQMAGEWQFEGIDLDKGEERTFRYDSVIGAITSQETGELFINPESWRDSIR